MIGSFVFLQDSYDYCVMKFAATNMLSRYWCTQTSWIFMASWGHEYVSSSKES